MIALIRQELDADLQPGDLYVALPQEFSEYLRWEQGDEIEWTIVMPQGYLKLRKVEKGPAA